MFKGIRRKVRELKGSGSGNATLLMALGMPALIGGAGLAVDTAQWYMWKRELQFAADQAALAGAWARTSSDTEAMFQERALQEVDANLSTTSEIIGTPTAELADYGTGTGNSVLVTVSAQKRLPFSSFLTGEATTVVATAQAAFAGADTYSACILAVNKTAGSSVIVQGNVTMAQNCGIAALSNADEAITRNGSASDMSGGDLTSRGGIDDDFETIDGININEYIQGLYDPYESLTPPIDATAKYYDCADVAADTEYPFTHNTWTVTSHSKQQFSSESNTADLASVTWIDVSDATYPYNETGTVSPEGVAAVPTGKKVKTDYETNPGTWDYDDPTGPVPTTKTTKVKGKTVTTTTYTWTRTASKDAAWESYEAIKTTGKAASTEARLEPGTYTDIKVSCKTTFTGGIYVLNGGQFKVNGTDIVRSESGMMLVLMNGATIDINGGSNVHLRPMTKTELDTAIAEGDDITSGSDTALLAGMLIFEIKNNSGNLYSSKINGNSGLTINGTIYMPQSEFDLSGNAQVSSDCLMIAASKIKFSGNMTFTNMCPDDSDQLAGIGIGGSSNNVRLVN